MINKKIFLCAIFCFSASYLAFCQDNTDERKMLKKAEKYFKRADYLRAFSMYSQVFNTDTSNYAAGFKAGLCLYKINKTDSNSTAYFLKTKALVPDAHFYLGKRYQLTGKSRQALDEFYYCKVNGTGDLVSGEELNETIIKCRTELLSDLERENYLVKNLGGQINTIYPEYVPLIWNDTALIFTSKRPGIKHKQVNPYGQYCEDIYISKRSGDGWTSPSLMSPGLSTETNDACVAFSAGNNELIVYKTDEQLTGGDLYFTIYRDGDWTTPVIFGAEINSDYLEASACFSESGGEIIFSSNRPGGYGGKDLYKVIRFLNGRYSLPVNLGPEINTSDEEDAPFIDKNDHALYFSSRGHNSIGEYDIFKAEYDPEKERWTHVVNLGQPVNSANDDIYFVKQEGKNTAYFASSRYGGFGDVDIYEVSFSESTKTVVSCRLKTDPGRTYVDKDLQVSLFDVKTGKLEGLYQLQKNYENLILIVNKDCLYEVRLEGNGINTISRQFVFGDNSPEIVMDIVQKPN